MSLSPSEIAAATKAIQDHHRILITPHANVDPDGLSSALACYQLFTALGKEVTVVCPDTLPEMLQFLPGYDKLTQGISESQQFVISMQLPEGSEIDQLRYTVEDSKVNIIVVPKKGKIRSQQITFAEGDGAYDLLVVVDTADLALLGSLYTDHVDLFSEVPILNVDHHISNTRFGQLALIDPTASSATEVLYGWFTHVPDWAGKITPDLATLLLTGLITDTRSFQNPNTTPRSLEVAAELLERGARQQEIIQHIYKTKPLSTLRIWGRALNRIQVDAAARIVWSSIAKEDLQEMEASSSETHGILDELISTVPNADVHVLFTELEGPSTGSGGAGGLKASMRSSAAIDCSRLAAETFGGGGHPRAAGFRVKSYDNFSLQVLQCVQKLKEGMERQSREGEAPSPVATPKTKFTPSSKEMTKAQEKKIPKAKQKDIVEGLSNGKVKKGDTDVMKEIAE